MNNELYLNETTKVGVVVDDGKKLKRVESNENEETIRILSIQNEIEKENEYLIMFRKNLEDSKMNIKYKYFFYTINFLMLCPFIWFILKITEAYIINKIIAILIATFSATVWMQLKYIRLFGTFKENRLNIKELPKEIEKSNGKIKVLEEELKNLKEKCNYNENKISNEAMIKLAVVNYPERTNEETLSANFQLPAKIKKIIFDHDGTTK